MAERDEQEIAITTAQAIANVRKLALQLEEYNGTVEKVVAAAVQFNNAGEITGTTLTSLTNTGQQVTRRFAEIEGQLNLTAVAMRNLAAGTDEEIQKIAELARKGSLLQQAGITQNKAGRFVRQTASGKKEFVSNAEVADIQRQEQEMTQELIRVAGKSRRELNLIQEEGSKIQQEIAAANLEAEKKIHERQLAELIEFEQSFAKNTERHQVTLDSAAKEEAARREKVLKDQQAYYDKLLAEDKQAKERELTQAIEFNQVAQKGLQLRDQLRQQAADQAAQQRTAAANAQAAQQVPGILRSNIPNLPFNTSQLNTIQQAIKNISRSVGEGKISVQEVMKVMQAEMTKTGEVFTGAAGTIQNQVGRITRAMDQASAAQERMTKAQRVFRETAQFIKFGLMIQGYFALTNAIKQAARDAVQFEIRIAEIRTISQDAQQTTERWAGQIRSLSDALGEPAIQVAEGVYETISNQIAKGGDATNFMAQAMKFAVTTVSTTADAVNLLSSVLNSYQLDATETERVSAILFKTIDLGRVRASEMANTFGRIGVSAHALGVSVEETAAAIATLTIQGIKPAEAFTQLNAVMVELVKPTKEMQKTFREWGVDSGQSAIKTFGFVGVLDKLSRSTNGSAAEFAKLFNNVRGLRGALGLAGSNFNDYARTLGKITEEAIPQYQKAVQIAFENPGRQITIELNKVRNFFLYDFGRPLLQTALSIGDAFGGGKGLAEGVKNVTAAVKFATVAWLSYRAAILTVAAAEKLASLNRDQNIAGLSGIGRATDLASRGLSSLVTAQNLITVAFAAGTLIYLDYQRKVANVATAHEEAVNEILKNYTKLNDAIDFNLNQQTDHVRKAIDDEFRLRSQAIAERVRLSNQALDEDKKNVAELGKVVEDLAQLQVEAVRQQVNELEKLFENSKKNAEDARKAVADIAASFKEENFRFQLDFADGVDRVKLITDRIKALGEEFHNLLNAKATTPEEGQENLKRAIAAYREQATLSRDVVKEATKLTKEREEITKRIADLELKISGRTAIRSAQQTVRDIRDRQGRLRQQTPLGRQLRSAQQDLAGVRSEEAERAEADELHALQEKLNLLNAQLNLYPNLQEATRGLADINVKAQQALSDYATQWNKLSDDQKGRLDERREQLKQFQTVVKDLLKFKLPDVITPLANLTGKSGFLGKIGQGGQQILDKIAVDTALKNFDALIDKASEFGQIDFSSMSKLIEYRIALEKQATDQVTAYHKKNEAERTQSTQEELKKRVEANEKANRANITAFEQGTAAFGGSINQLKAFLDLIRSEGAQLKGWDKETFDDLTASVKDLEAAFIEFQKHPTAGALQDVQAKFGRAFKGVGGSQASLADIAGLQIPGQEPSATSPGKTVQDIINSFNQAMAQIRKSFADRQALEADRQKLNKDLQSQGINVKDLIPSVQSFDQALRDATETLKKFRDSVPQQPGQPTAFATPTPPTFAPQTTTANASFGDIIINYQGTGNTAADADQLARSIQNRIRLGFVGTPAEA